MQELLKVRESPWINGRQPADLPSLRFSLANPGPWLLDSSEEPLKAEAGSADARGWSQLSVGENTQVSTLCKLESKRESKRRVSGSHGAHSMGRPGEHRVSEAN